MNNLTATESRSEETWNAVQETFYLNSIPGMRQSILKGMEETIEECAESIDL